MGEFEVSNNSEISIRKTQDTEAKNKTLMQDLKTIFNASGLSTKTFLFTDIFEYCRNNGKDAQLEKEKLASLLVKYNSEVVEFEQKLREILEQMPWQAEKQCRKIEELLGVGV